jgi:uncharacterized membrane protein
MDRMLVAVFDNESNAYEGLRALHELDADATIAVYAAAVVAKDFDGLAAVKKHGDPGLMGTATGIAVGALIGLVGGPVGVAVGAAGGSLVGWTLDFENARVGSDFIEEVTKALAPGKVAVVAEIDEEWTTPVDTRIEAVGGQIFRRSLWEVVDAEDERDKAAIQADIAQLKSEHASASAERKAKLQAKIDALNAKLKANSDKAKARREAIRREVSAKLEGLKAKAAQAKHDIKAKHDQRIAAFTEHFYRWLEGGDLSQVDPSRRVA